MAPIQKRYLEIMEDRTYLESVLRQGKVQAEAIANETLNNASKAMGFTQAL
jgi:tryptophanyl-tRNA synthetase